MTPRPQDSLKPLAARLAELLAEHDGARTLALLQRLGVGSGVAPSNGAAREAGAAASGNGRAIGIWHPLHDGGPTEYVRKEGEEWWLWADVERLPPRGRRPRILLLGESVARGFFYDPAFNPAAALEALLSAGPGVAGAEVVDLARIDQGRAALVELLRAAFALEPDAVVIFAGNNWHPHHELGPEAEAEIAGLLRQGAGLAGIRSYMERRMEGLAAAFVDEVAELGRRREVPTLLVVPEFNLRDWRDPRGEIPYLEPDLSERWAECREAAEQALEAGRLDEARRHAAELAAIDRGLSPSGPGLLAELCLRQDELGEARLHLERARDACLWSAARRTPRCYAVTQAALRRRGRQRGLTVVDLPRRFEEWLGGALPDRSLFHDYCHLTARGMQVAMACVASELLRLLWRRRVPWREMAARAAGVAPGIVARAHLLAAIHNDSWGQSREVVAHHCAEAVRADPQVVRAMSLIAQSSTGRTPPAMTAAFDELVRSGEQALARFCMDLAPLTREKLTAGIVEATRAVDPGLEGRLAAARREQDGIAGGEIDLLEARFSRSSYDQTDGVVGGAAFYRCFGRRSRFLLVCGAAEPVRFALTYRAPAPSSPVVRVLVNGAEVHQAPLSTAWAGAEFIVSAPLREGANEIVVEWPVPRLPVDALRRVAERIEAGRAPDPGPIFGAIGAFVARSCAS